MRGAFRIARAAALPAAAAAAAAAAVSVTPFATRQPVRNDSILNAGVKDETVSNWSGTHQVTPNKFYAPDNEAELEALLAEAHVGGAKLRPVGQALSPNGLSMSNKGMISVANLDRIKAIDMTAKTVTVEAGVRVSEVLKELDRFGLTLANFSSIQEQQIGGWTQVAAHGTGATLPTVEEQIVSMRLVTPSKGVLTLSEDEDPELFNMAKAGLGALGVVSEVTLHCVEKHKLLENSTVMSRLMVARHHRDRLKAYRHLRYMWIPYTDRVVVVCSNPYPRNADPKSLPPHVLEALEAPLTETDRVITVLEYAERIAGIELTPELKDSDIVDTLSFAALRDRLLDIDPLNVEHIKKVAQSELAYWNLAAGWRFEDSTDVLGFDCGGEQWVLEVAFPITGDDPKVDPKDITFIDDCLKALEDAGIPAPSPIEQRWTASSTAPMSPAFDAAAPTAAAPVHSWVGVIMYLTPGQDKEGRAAITERFNDYTAALAPVYEKYGAVPHWAKLEIGKGWGISLENQRRLLRERYDVDAFNKRRMELDPKGVLANDWVEKLLD